MHRVATSGRYHSSLVEIKTQWTMDDLLDAILVLDMYDEIDWEANRPKDT